MASARLGAAEVAALDPCKFMAVVGNRVTAVDVAPVMLELAEDNARAARLGDRITGAVVALRMYETHRPGAAAPAAVPPSTARVPAAPPAAVR